MTDENILDQTRDQDTLGGRISRAREALNMSSEEAAINIGVTQETYDNWEMDRDDPRSNKLVNLAGVLNVSATWLLHGIGEAPSFETLSEEIAGLKSQLVRIRELHQATGTAIETLEQSLERLIENDE